VKCPKCNYLGFETGDRCKNCGYDFSLLGAAERDPADYEIHPLPEDDVPVHVIDEVDPRELDQADPWLGISDDPLGGKHGPEPSPRDNIDDVLSLTLTPEEPFANNQDLQLGPDFAEHDMTPAVPMAPLPPPVIPPPSAVVPFITPAVSTSSESALPLFMPAEDEDDEPLIKLPAAPRAPLSVRRTPDTPRLRAVPRPTSRPSPAPVLQFSEEVAERPAPQAETSPVATRARGSISGQSSRPGPRLIAAAIDYAILLGIDAGVIYFTVRMAGLSPGEWTLLPIGPMAAFLALLKIAYFYAFTAVGGQTIGKMAVGTCVIADDGSPVDAARAMRRTSAGVLSFLLLGLGYIPALVGEHRALHDRLAGTRVIRLRSV
jgi:uncharacterized RDD family membrane protein YckC